MEQKIGIYQWSRLYWSLLRSMHGHKVLLFTNSYKTCLRCATLHIVNQTALGYLVITNRSMCICLISLFQILIIKEHDLKNLLYGCVHILRFKEYKTQIISKY